MRLNLKGLNYTTKMLAEGAKISERVVALFAGDEFMYRLALIYRAFIEQTGWEVWMV